MCWSHARGDIRTLAATPTGERIGHGLLAIRIRRYVLVALAHRIFRHPLYLGDSTQITGAATGGIIRRREEGDCLDSRVHTGVKQVIGSVLILARIYLAADTLAIDCTACCDDDGLRT